MKQSQGNEVIRFPDPTSHHLALLDVNTAHPANLFALHHQGTDASTNFNKLLTCVGNFPLDFLNVLRRGGSHLALVNRPHEVHALRIFPAASELSWHCSCLLEAEYQTSRQRMAWRHR